MAIHIDCHGETHVGRHRSSNEDQFLIADLNKSMRIHQTSLGLSHQTRLFGGSQGKLLLVADGLGGHESGERASTLAVDGVANHLLNAMDWFLRVNSSNQSDFEADLANAFRHSQDVVEAEADAIPQRRGMATTMTMAYVDWPKVYVVHVGDTRCYHISDGRIHRVTTDHTMEHLIKLAATQNRIDEKDQDTNPAITKHTLWNVIGGNTDSLEPQISRAKLNVEDSLLLCSDGLTSYVNDNEILQMIEQKKTSKEVCQCLIQLANDRGGRDNITAVHARFNQGAKGIEDHSTAENEFDSSQAKDVALDREPFTSDGPISIPLTKPTA